MFNKKKDNNNGLTKNKDLEKYIYLLESEKSHLEGDIKTLERQMNRTRNSYLEPLRNILNVFELNESEENKLNYVITQISNFLVEKNLEIYKPEIGTQHDKSIMIVEDTIITEDKSKIDKIECVLSVGIKSNNEIILPAKVRIYKGV